MLPSGVTQDGLTAADACKKLEDAGAAVVGLNCGMGPSTMLPVLKEVKKVCKVVLHVFTVLRLRQCSDVCHLLPLKVSTRLIKKYPLQ